MALRSVDEGEIVAPFDERVADSICWSKERRVREVEYFFENVRLGQSAVEEVVLWRVDSRLRRFGPSCPEVRRDESEVVQVD